LFFSVFQKVEILIQTSVVHRIKIHPWCVYSRHFDFFGPKKWCVYSRHFFFLFVCRFFFSKIFAPFCTFSVNRGLGTVAILAQGKPSG
jgi:hypothetical protein